MRATVVFVGLIAIACAQTASAQGTRLYDMNYAGPMNVYGQPTYSVPTSQQPSGALPAPADGLIPATLQGVWAAGSYLWSYAPAALRGVQSPYKIAPGQGQVIVNFVPGAP